MKSLLSVIDGISVWSGKISAFLILLVTLVVSYEVVLRYLFNSPTSWGLELTVFICAAIYVMGMAYVHYERGHISVDLVRTRVSARQRAIIDSFAFFFLIIIIGILVWESSKASWSAFITHETAGTIWDPPILPFRLSLLLGAFLLALQGVAHFIRDISFAITGRKL